MHISDLLLGVQQEQQVWRQVNLIEPDESLCSCLKLIGSSVQLAEANIAGIKLAPEQSLTALS